MNLKTITFVSGGEAATLDLINYNFDQLLANGYGQQGVAGGAGAGGTVGTQGAQGPQGAQGAQGTAGGSVNVVGVEWLNDTTTVSGTNIMVPKPAGTFDPPITTQTSVLIGSGSTSSNDQLSQLVVGRNIYDFDSNIRLTVPGSVNYVDFTQNINELVMAFNSGAADTVFKINGDEIKFSDSLDSDQFALFSATSTIFNKDVKIDAAVTFNDILKLGIGDTATAGQILVSADNDGTLEWATPSVLGTNVPLGTVVPILSDVYNSTNFYTTSANSSTVADYTTFAGKGKGSYNGWYLCHGYTWFKTTGGAVSYETPDVSGKKFTDNVTILQAQTYDKLLSGATLDIVANSGGGSDVVTTLDTAEIVKKLANDSTVAQHTPFNLVKVPHIIFLGVDSDLVWRFTDITDTTITYGYYQLGLTDSIYSFRKWNDTTTNPTCGSSSWADDTKTAEVTAWIKKVDAGSGQFNTYMSNSSVADKHLYKSPGVLFDTGTYRYETDDNPLTYKFFTWNKTTMTYLNEGVC